MNTKLAPLGFLLALLLIAVSVPVQTSAQQRQLPAELQAMADGGVAIDLLSGAVVTPNREASALVLDRIVPQGGAHPIAIMAGPEFWYVEAGMLTLGPDDQTGTTYHEGETAVLSESGSYTYQIEGKSCPAVLRLQMTTVFAMEVGSEVSGPTLAQETARCPASGTLLRNAGSLTFPDSATFGFIARMTWPAGTIPSERTLSGPIGYATETGMLNVSLIPGGNATIGPNSSIIVDSRVIQSVSGAGGNAATALVAGILSNGSAPAATPTTTSGIRGTSYESPTYGYAVGWDATWSAGDESSAAGEDVLHLSNGASDVYLHSYGNYTYSVQTCVESIGNQLPTQAGYAQVKPLTTAGGDPVAGGDDSRAFAAYTFQYTGSDNTTAPWVEYVECRPLAGQTAVLVITQFVKLAAYPGQIETVNQLLDAIVIPEV